jgi:Concanavalin A-like lectin/glucanases superfamily
MEVEFRKKDVFTKLPEIALTRGGGGISGKISSWDTKWHHVAVSSDEYYSYLYLDGKFVCRAVTAYFGRDTGKKLFQFGWQPGNGSSIRNFAGDLREFRISTVDRYPRSKGFEPPAILGCDEHVTCQLDLREGKLALRRLDKDRLRVSLIVDNVEVIKIPAGE